MSIVSVVVYVVCSDAGQSRTKDGQAVSVWTSVTVTVDIVMGTVVVGGSVCEMVVWVSPGSVADVAVSMPSESSSSSVQSSSSPSGICVASEPASVEVELVIVATLEGGGLGVGV
jgi:hypothetical protein